MRCSVQIARSMLIGRLGDGLDMVDLRHLHYLTMTLVNFTLDVDVSGVLLLGGCRSRLQDDLC